MKASLHIPNLPSQRFSCHRCTDCCRHSIVHLTEAERSLLDRQQWSRSIGQPVYSRHQRQWVLNKTQEGVCVLLSVNGKCRIHERFGSDAKPLACRVFPFELSTTGSEGYRVSWQFSCPSIAANRGKPVQGQAAELKNIAKSFGVFTERADAGRDLQHAESDRTIVSDLDHWFSNNSRCWESTLSRAIRATEILHPLKSDRGREIALREALSDDHRSVFGARMRNDDSPTDRHLFEFRQLIWIHADWARFRAGDPSAGKTVRRLWNRLSAVRAFRLGQGAVPHLQGLPGGLIFEKIEQVGPSIDDSDFVSGLLTRYVRMRLLSHSFYGAGYYGWTLQEGLQALWSVLLISSWVARAYAASEGRSFLNREDAIQALAQVDRASRQLPHTRRVSAKLRSERLARDDGFTALSRAYPMTLKQTHEAENAAEPARRTESQAV